MSLVVCSNQDENRRSTQTGATSQSIFKPYSFRNGLSSTYKIPPNSQVALQSAKYTLDGRLPLTSNSNVLYQYYGDDLEDNEDINQLSTSCPIRTPIFEGRNNDVIEVTPEQVAQELNRALGENIFHPQLRDLVDVNVKRDGTSNEFQGFTIDYDYLSDANNTIPGASEIESQVSVSGENEDEFTWDGTNFETVARTSGMPSVGILTGKPISLHNGSFVVDFNDPNSASLEWAVGLSRYVNTNRQGDASPDLRAPSYYFFPTDIGGQLEAPEEQYFFDYVVCRDSAGILKVYHNAYDSDNITTYLNGTTGTASRELVYGQDDVAADYDIETNASAYHKVRFTMEGQKIKIEMLDTDGLNPDVLYEYNSARTNEQQLSAVSQAKWSMYPLLYIESNATTFGNSLVVDQYTGATNVTTTVNSLKNSWFNSVEGTEYEGLALELETRDWNDQAVTPRTAFLTYKGILGGANAVINLENYLIMAPSDVFKPSGDANTEKILGFEGASPTKSYVYGSVPAPTTRRTFTSVSTPVFLATRSMFIRLDNLTQQSVNALMGNKSSIIAHLPRFDGQVETGRLYHEPKNLIFLDLNNSNELSLSSFDISFVYSNEQFVESLTGTSVVVLYFRQRPS
tara:strand:+ start:7032 stop:8912 length:1881 start_codon:yes stop_codon:yes gene_type:complete